MPYILRLSDVARRHKDRAAQFLFSVSCFIAMIVLMATAGHSQVSESEMGDVRRDVAVNAERARDIETRVEKVEEKQGQIEHIATVAESEQTKLKDDMEYIKSMLHAVIFGIIGLAGRSLIEATKWFMQKATAAKGTIVTP